MNQIFLDEIHSVSLYGLVSQIVIESVCIFLLLCAIEDADKEQVSDLKRHVVKRSLECFSVIILMTLGYGLVPVIRSTYQWWVMSGVLLLALGNSFLTVILICESFSTLIKE